MCPEGKPKRAKLVVSSRCSAQDASFEQTTGFFSFFIAIVVAFFLGGGVIIFWLSFSFAPAPQYLMTRTTLLKNTPSKCQH